MKVYERLAQAFVGEGVNTIFGMMGDGNMYWMESLDKLGVKMLEVRHEGVGCGMADGWARATRTVGVCTATCGPGVPQLATGLMVASRAASPVVAFVGESPQGDREYAQRMDQARFAAGVEAAYVHIDNVDDTDEAVRRAFYMARLESRPVMFGAAMDIQQKTFEGGDEPYRPGPKLPTSIAQGVPPAPEQLEAAVKLITSAKKPVVVVGRGAIWSGAGDAARKLATRIGALIGTTLRAKTFLSDDEYHAGVIGNYSSRSAMQLFQDADCVVIIGASMTRYSTMQGFLFPNAKYVHIDPKAYVMMEAGLTADVYVQADGRVGAQALEEALAKKSFKGTGFRTGEVKERLANQYDDRQEYALEPGTVDPRQVVLALEEMLPANFNLCTGSGASTGFSSVLFTRPRPLVMSAQFFGCIGQMLPAAMGAIQATGNKPMLLVDGDASTIMHLSDWDTAVRYNMPLLLVVLNDQALGSEYHKMVAHKMKSVLSTIPTPDLGAVSQAMGGKGKLVRTVDDLRTSVKEWIANPSPMLIDARISRTVITVSMRRVLYGEDA